MNLINCYENLEVREWILSTLMEKMLPDHRYQVLNAYDKRMKQIIDIYEHNNI